MKHSNASLARILVLMIPILVCLFLAVDSTPCYADEPEASPSIPSHRVGHVAKSQNLDMIVAQSAGTDPLSGNYLLAKDDEIMVTYRYSTDKIFQWETLDVSDDLAALTLLYDGNVSGYGATSAMGRLNSDIYEDFSLLWRQPSSLYMSMEVGYSHEGAAPTEYALSTDEGAYKLPLSLAIGDYDGDGTDEIAMGWQGGSSWANVKVYDISMGAAPVATDKIYDEKLGNGNVYLAAGDLDGNGDDEIVMAWGNTGNQAGVKIYDVDNKGKITPKATWLGGGAVDLAIATGDYNGDGTDEMALIDGETVRIFSASKDLSSLKKGDGYDFLCSGEEGGEILRFDVASGDFNVDGVDEIVAACWSSKHVSLFTTSGLNPKLKAEWIGTDSMSGGSLAVGDLNKDLRPEIVFAWSQWVEPQPVSQQSNHVQILEVTTALDNISAKGKKDLGTAPVGTQLSVSLGDINGDSMRVGTPTYQFLDRAVQNIAIINAPPKHKDEIDGVVYDVNVTDACSFPPCTYAEYETEQKSSSEMSMTTNRDWAVSSELDAKYAFVKSSLEASYGQNFEKTTSSFKSMTFGQEVLADRDDAIVETVQLIDVWEYPVYADSSDTVVGHILVTWPRKVDPTCTSHCSADMLTTLDGLSPNARYLPNHVFGNVMTYSNQLPANVKHVIKSDTAHELGANPYEIWVEWSDVEDSEDKKSSKMDLKASLSLDAFGQDFKVSGKYSQGSISVHKVSFETDTSIHLYFYNIDGKYRYSVQPIFYWAKPDGHLVLDYAVAPVEADPPTWWQNTYDLPDPAFSLPWFATDPTPGYKILTREITFEPRSPTVTDTVTISARIRNFSLVSVDNVQVALYVGDPDNGGVQIGTDQNITTTIEPMSSYTVSVQLDASGYGGQTLDIYGVIDPHDTIDEIHDEDSPPNNNKAYVLLPIKPQQQSTRPQSLSVQSIATDYDVNAARVETMVHISATIKAIGTTFTYVVAEFWDGDPHQGGKFIGAETIPMLLADNQAVLGVDWDTSGLLGAHDVWVSVYPLADIDELLGDNWGSEVVEFAPYYHYLPKLDLNEPTE